jgi:hypothetical protein
MRRPPGAATLRAALWTWTVVRSTRRALRREPFGAVAVPPPPALPSSAFRGVRVVLRRQDPTCLERSLVLQRWLASHGDLRDVIIGVSAPSEGFAAHAWLEGETPSLPYRELTRLAP